MIASNSSALKGNLKSLVATGGVLAGAGTASQAAIVYTDVAPDLTVSGPAGTIYFSLTGQAADTTGAVTEQFQLMFGFDPQHPFIQGAVNGGAVAGYTIGPYGYAFRLGANTPINSGQTFASPRDLAYDTGGQWNPGDQGYLGLRFNAGAGDRFGWADVSYNVGNSLTLHSFAFDDTGGPINAGQIAPVPEPAVTGAIAAVLAGSVAAFEARRRRKAAKQTIRRTETVGQDLT